MLVRSQMNTYCVSMQSHLAGAMSEESAVAAFSSKFKSKTGNAWDDRDSFVHKAGKYDLVEIDEVRVHALDADFENLELEIDE